MVLTYDDALDVHLDNAIPVLDSLGLKATFYITANASKGRMYDWKRVAQNGHELGNHTLYHPCLGGEGREWVIPENDLRNYNTQEIVREIEMTELYLRALDGKSSRTFAYTCGDTETSEGSFIPEIKDKFTALRGVDSQLNHIETMDFTDIKCYGLDGHSAEEMIQWAEKAREENALLVILFHGVGGGHSLNVSLENHRKFLEYLKTNEADYWVTTMEEAAQHCKDQKP
ncbi:polysaccharide deacetylase family protein [Reichenbachiella sp. ABR2-5]|uniref:Polysaccharide deacetylase family protein n=1 Tax=Reichenbachiella ulvae TaxID=2980104 RepID=A0ABT3CPL0_9BACT|nr:polysaccharide deacetylase family protein [Reichenbachiella ulvae]